VLAGPVIVGVAIAGGAAQEATRKGNIGNAARATGDATSDIGVSLKQFEREHQIAEKTTQGIMEGSSWISMRLKGKDDKSLQK
jgi:hypothetical protein